MKKIILLLTLITQFAFAQVNTTTTTAGKFKMNIPDPGAKKDSIVVWDGTSKLLKVRPVSQITGATNLDQLVAPTGISIFSSTGTDIVLPLATATNAGLLAPAEKTKLASISGTNTGDQDLSGLATTTAMNAALNAKENLSSKGVSNGYAGLDASGKVPLTQINDVLLGSVNYQGTYNAATNSPALPTVSTANKGFYFVVSAAGTQAGLALNPGDWIISNGTTWGKIDNNNAVTAVNGATGNVTLSTSNIAEGTNLYYNDARVNANASVAASAASRHNAVTIGTANGLSLSTQALSLGLASTNTTGALSSTDWNSFNNKANANGSNASGTWGIHITGNTNNFGGLTKESYLSNGGNAVNNINANDFGFVSILNTTGNGSGNSNFPHAYGTLVSFSETGSYFLPQIHFNASGLLQKRMRTAGNWTSWDTVLDSNNYNMYSNFSGEISGNSLTIGKRGVPSNPIMRIGLDTNAFSYSSIINGWGANTNAGITVGTARNDGIAFRVVTSATLDANFLPAGLGNVAFQVNGDNTAIFRGNIQGDGSPILKTIWGGAFSGGIQIKTDGATVDRYVRMGMITGAGVWNGGMRINNDLTAFFDGSITAPAFFQSSDRRLKTILKRDGDVAYFKWKDKRDTKTHIGYIAQEVKREFPDQVQQDEKGLLSVNYIEVLVAKVQALEKRIQELEQKK